MKPSSRNPRKHPNILSKITYNRRWNGCSYLHSKIWITNFNQTKKPITNSKCLFAIWKSNRSISYMYSRIRSRIWACICRMSATLQQFHERHKIQWITNLLFESLNFRKKNMVFKKVNMLIKTKNLKLELKKVWRISIHETLQKKFTAGQRIAMSQ